jgi:hypothetical protein
MELKKIKTKEEVEKKKKQKQIYLAVAIVFILLASILSYAIDISEKEDINSEKEIYGNFIFQKYNNFWKVSIKDENNKIIDNLNFYFMNSPKENYEFSKTIEEINEIKKIDNYNKKPLYVYSEDEISKAEILNNLFYSNLVMRIQEACLDYNSINQSKINNCSKENPDFPIKTCEDNFIIIEKDNNLNNPILEQINNCVFIRAKEQDLIKVTDEFLFKILEIK